MKAVRDGLAILLLGVVLGYLVSSLGATLVTDSSAFGAPSESPEAHAYMLGLLQDDPDTLAALRLQRGDVASRALATQTAEGRRGATKPLTLTYLGGGSQGRFQVHIYAVEFQSGSRTLFFSYALTLLNRKVVLVE